MVNIHLVQDEKFINNSIELFEKYYPKQNYFIVNSSAENCKHIKPQDNVFFMPFDNSQWIKNICEVLDTHSINILVHYLTKSSALRAMELKNASLYNRLYWIFYGADLYDYLFVKCNYQLYDYKKIGIIENIANKLRIAFNRYGYIEDFCGKMDYFCFWNPYDYQLLRSYLKTNASFKLFYYITNAKPDLKSLNKQYSKSKILINHSGSWTGNHLTILKALKNIDLDDKSIVLPLSYGSPEHIKLIEKEAKRLFPEKCEIIKEFLPLQTYYKIIDECQYAIMGHRRQEAGGNLSFLLLNGKKVFLREDNSLLRYYKDLGCHIYSLEKDLYEKEAFSPLSNEQKKQNSEILQKSLLKENIDHMMLNLFK